jgi:hypothetical protein
VQSGPEHDGVVKKDLIDATSWALIKARAEWTRTPLAALGANLGSWRVKGVCVIGSGDSDCRRSERAPESGVCH